MPGINMMPSGSTLQIPLDACTNFSGKAGNAQVTLTWTDPKDKYATPEGETAQDPDQLVSVWEYTQIIRKTGSQPAGPHDGELVVSSSVRDQYATTGFVDTGLVNGTLYYYAAYAYNTDGVASEGAFASATPITGTPLSQLAEGTLIKILENGSPVEFYLAKHNYEPGLNGQGRELMVRKDSVSELIVWNSSDIPQYINGSADSWLNSTYKNRFSSYVQSLIGSTGFYCTNNAQDDPSVSSYSRSIFMPSVTELGGFSGTGFMEINEEGEEFPVASTIRQASTKSYESRTVNLRRDQIVGWSYFIYGEGKWGYIDCDANHSQTGNYPRPCLSLPSTAFIDVDLNLVEE